jgi:acetyltransferase-like isoleucine patch superfamily enzyme
MIRKQIDNKLSVIWRFIVPTLVVNLYYLVKYSAKISPRAEVELSRNLKLGAGCKVSSFTKIKASQGPLVMGARCGVATGCFISSGDKGIEIGDDFICGPNSVITASNYVYERLDVPLEEQGYTSRGIRIGNNVWLGAGTIVLDGTALGDNTVVMANSLVNRRYPPNSILQGNPAKVILKRSKGEDA